MRRNRCKTSHHVGSHCDSGRISSSHFFTKLHTIDPTISRKFQLARRYRHCDQWGNFRPRVRIGHAIELPSPAMIKCRFTATHAVERINYHHFNLREVRIAITVWTKVSARAAFQQKSKAGHSGKAVRQPPGRFPTILLSPRLAASVCDRSMESFHFV